jgi:hypothetical protein
MLGMGPDCVRHGFLGCIIANNGTPPGDQARSYLLSLREANRVSHVTGETAAEREWRVQKFDAEIREWFRRLEEWEKTNVVVMPQPITGYPVSITERPPPLAPPKLTAASAAELQILERLRAQKHDEDAALAEREGTTTH